jgi:hypothetical protein
MFILAPCNVLKKCYRLHCKEILNLSLNHTGIFYEDRGVFYEDGVYFMRTPDCVHVEFVGYSQQKISPQI